MKVISNHTKEAIALLQNLIVTPSISRQENNTAVIFQNYLEQYCKNVNRIQNNIWVKNLHFDNNKPTILLNFMGFFLRLPNSFNKNHQLRLTKSKHYDMRIT